MTTPNTATLTSGDYAIIVSVPDGRYFARPVDPDEGYRFEWVVLDEETGDHLANTSEEIAHLVVDHLNRVRGPQGAA